MHYDFIAIPDADVPQAVEPVFQHVVTTYASEANKTASVWRAVPDNLLDFKTHAAAAAVRGGDDGLVAGGAAVLRQSGASAGLDILAAGVAHLPSSDAGADVAEARRA